MDVLDTFRSTAQEIVSLAKWQGIDLDSFRTDFTFHKDRRWIDVWRKDSSIGSGPATEPPGTLHYSMQGTIAELPRKLKESATAFHGAWHEAGTFENTEQAVELVKAWLIDWKEVDDLPSRATRSYGIG
jgi:hypothetical protein